MTDSVYLLTGFGFEKICMSKSEAIFAMLDIAAKMHGWKPWEGMQHFEPDVVQRGDNEVSWKKPDGTQMRYHITEWSLETAQGMKAVRLANQIDYLGSRVIEEQQVLSGYQDRLSDKRDELHKLGV